MKILILFFNLLICQSVLAEQVVNMLNWSGYIPQSVLQQFQKKTGIHVNLATIDDNPELYTKLKLDPGVYDVVSPSSYYVERLRDQGLLQKLDKSKLPNIRYLNPQLLHFKFDPHNDYSLPFFWGTTGIVVNDRYFDPKSISTWQDLWSKQYRDQLLVLNEAREVFDIALTTLGYSINDQNPKHLHEAYLKLKTLMPNIKLFNEAQEDSIYADEDASIGAALNGDAYRAWLGNKHIHYIYPKGKTLIWIDTLAIPAHAPHLSNAYKLINFLMQPKIAKELALYVGYSSPNLGAINLLPKSVKTNYILYPSKTLLKNSEVEASQTEATKSLIQHYWELLKLN